MDQISTLYIAHWETTGKYRQAWYRARENGSDKLYSEGHVDPSDIGRCLAIKDNNHQCWHRIPHRGARFCRSHAMLEKKYDRMKAGFYLIESGKQVYELV